MATPSLANIGAAHQQPNPAVANAWSYAGLGSIRCRSARPRGPAAVPAAPAAGLRRAVERLDDRRRRGRRGEDAHDRGGSPSPTSTVATPPGIQRSTISQIATRVSRQVGTAGDALEDRGLFGDHRLGPLAIAHVARDHEHPAHRRFRARDRPRPLRARGSCRRGNGSASPPGPAGRSPASCAANSIAIDSASSGWRKSSGR